MTTYYSKVIRIRAEDSPNVKLALAQKDAGLEPTGELVLQGVLPWRDYQVRRATWDVQKQCVSLDAEFYEGKEVKIYPMAWLVRAGAVADGLRGRKRVAKAVGVDPAEGGDSTCMCAVDELGAIEMQSMKTPDTSVIPGAVLAFARKYGCSDDNIVFDRGGGGKQHADAMRRIGHRVRTVGFGEGVSLEVRSGRHTVKDRREVKEERYTYTNRRSEMYGELRVLLDPSEKRGFGVPTEMHELRRQLSLIPLVYDAEGRLAMLPKRNTSKDAKALSLTDIVGHSPDEADALVLAVHGMLHRSSLRVLGALA